MATLFYFWGGFHGPPQNHVIGVTALAQLEIGDPKPSMAASRAIKLIGEALTLDAEAKKITSRGAQLAAAAALQAAIGAVDGVTRDEGGCKPEVRDAPLRTCTHSTPDPLTNSAALC